MNKITTSKADLGSTEPTEDTLCFVVSGFSKAPAAFLWAVAYQSIFSFSIFCLEPPIPLNNRLFIPKYLQYLLLPEPSLALI
jgi:hypothetical protein